MKRPVNYSTRQSEAILSYIASLTGAHITVSQIAAHFKSEGSPIGLTTIYRYLDKLADSGTVRKYIIDGISGACYQYIDKHESCQEHFHLKCEDCGILLHLQCDMLNEVRQHILDRYAFQINTMKTVFYGKCETCLYSN